VKEKKAEAPQAAASKAGLPPPGGMRSKKKSRVLGVAEKRRVGSCESGSHVNKRGEYGDRDRKGKGKQSRGQTFADQGGL